MIEQSLTFIKPKHINLAEKILHEVDDELYNYGTRIKTVKVNSIPREIIANHYAPHKGKFFFDYMVDYFENNEGEGIIEKLKKFVGPTDPVKASKRTIRGKYGTDSLDKANAEGRPTQNVIHRSDSVEEAYREINVWKSYFD